MQRVRCLEDITDPNKRSPWSQVDPKETESIQILDPGETNFLNNKVASNGMK